MKVLITSLCTLGMMGCVMEDGDLTETSESNDDLMAPPQATADAAPKQSLLAGTQSLGSTNTEWALWPHGGWGGQYTGHVTPPAVIYAVRVSSGTYVDSIAFGWYQPIGSDNRYRSGDPWGSTASYGGSGGGDNGWWYCPTDQGVIGIRGNSGSLVDRIGVICGDVSNPDPYSPYNTYSPLWGGSGGYWFDDRCGRDRLVDSFNVRSASLVDNLQAICIDAH